MNTKPQTSLQQCQNIGNSHQIINMANISFQVFLNKPRNIFLGQSSPQTTTNPESQYWHWIPSEKHRGNETQHNPG